MVAAAPTPGYLFASTPGFVALAGVYTRVERFPYVRPVACLTAAIGVMMVLSAAGQDVAPRDAVAPRRPAQQAASASPQLAGRVTAASDGTPLRRASIA